MIAVTTQKSGGVEWSGGRPSRRPPNDQQQRAVAAGGQRGLCGVIARTHVATDRRVIVKHGSARLGKRTSMLAPWRMIGVIARSSYSPMLLTTSC